MCHQIEIKRQLLRGEFFKQREYVAAFGRGDEIIGVFNAGGDALQIG
jgi:hypothetical protein